MSQPEGPILLFDGECNLCNGAVKFVIRRDRREVFRFASLQSATARALLQKVGRPPRDLDTVVLIDGDRAFLRSDAVLEVARRLGGCWTMVSALVIAPKAIRDRLYDLVARRRRRWFGRSEHCSLPTPDTPQLAERFIDTMPRSTSK